MLLLDILKIGKKARLPDWGPDIYVFVDVDDKLRLFGPETNKFRFWWPISLQELSRIDWKIYEKRS